MNTTGLAKHYGHLTAPERLPLLMAAALRGDEEERLRLMGSAPKVGFQVPDYFGLGNALTEATTLYLLTLLDLAANFWQWWGLWLAPKGPTDSDKGKRKATAKANQSREFRLYCMVRYHAYRFVAHVDAWKQFCSELTIDPEAGLNLLPGWDIATRTRVQAGELAFTREDAALFLLSEAVEPDGAEAAVMEVLQVETVEGLAKAWHTILDRRQKWWTGNSNS
jgi:hypothetical protein